MPELKPCPWCGSPARMVQMAHMERDDQIDALAYALGLPATAYRGSPANVECSNADCQASGPFLMSAEQAEHAWNSMAQQKARADRLEKLLREIANAGVFITCDTSRRLMARIEVELGA